ncbi:hypothetical protein [Geodermatophilus poikilotrophus]|uniref:hypothetical protein n=1 Tax=Geodermatophilus poikilotrophus TaxID=1333667 RepID=UPI002481DF12|nr:hypothetical protein [Geodermatophilus poikilotrophus]
MSSNLGTVGAHRRRQRAGSGPRRTARLVAGAEEPRAAPGQRDPPERVGLLYVAELDEALRALVARYRSAEVEASYTAYAEHPLNEPDEWGALASLSEAAGRSRLRRPRAVRSRQICGDLAVAVDCTD